MAAKDVSWCQAPGHVPKRSRRSRPEQWVHGEALAGPKVVACRAERVRADQHPLCGPPERGLPPPATVAHAKDLEGRAGNPAEKQAVEVHADPLGQARAVALVAIEQLDDAGICSPSACTRSSTPSPSTGSTSHTRPFARRACEARFRNTGSDAIQPNPNAVSSQKRTSTRRFYPGSPEKPRRRDEARLICSPQRAKLEFRHV
jgi:hypothetical protein